MMKSTLELDTGTCYAALQAHDARFDGVFYVAVATTGIYCRTVCTARLPLQKNCRFYPTAASAEAAGFRPCLKCRPELAPGKAPIDAAGRLAQQIASKIEDGALAEFSVSELASSLELSERHLRRIVAQEFGVSPIALAQTQRLHVAKRLLTDTNLPVTEAAFASGFNSIRRFNSLFKERYGLNPTTLRRTRAAQLKDERLHCSLSYRPPYDWAGTLKFLQARAIAGVERVDNESYSRTVGIDGHTGWIVVTQDPVRNRLELSISMSLSPVIVKVLAKTRRLFDLNCDPISISEHLGVLAAGVPGIRVPGAWNGYELAIRAICGQQITVKAATTLSGRIAAKFGDPLETGVEGLTHIFPEPCRILAQRADELFGCGLIGTRVRTVLSLSEAIASNGLAVEPGRDPEQTISELKQIPGIGDWTAHYIAMRALSWPDAFPASDLCILKALGTKDPLAAVKQSQRWSPWRAYAAMHLWRQPETKT